jgi:transposase InsO family protein
MNNKKRRSYIVDDCCNTEEDSERSKKQLGRKKSMKISEWLDKKEADGVDVSQITLPEGTSYDEAPNETMFFKEINPDGMLSTADHPFSAVERFGHWYYCRGSRQGNRYSLIGTGVEAFYQG